MGACGVLDYYLEEVRVELAVALSDKDGARESVCL